MGYFDEKFYKRAKKHRRNYEIDDDLYTRLESYTRIYEAKMTDLVNASIEHLIETENIVLYQKSDDQLPVTHTFLVRESNVAGLERLKAKYGVSIYKLVNIAIKNVLDEYEAEKRMG